MINQLVYLYISSKAGLKHARLELQRNCTVTSREFIYLALSCATASIFLPLYVKSTGYVFLQIPFPRVPGSAFSSVALCCPLKWLLMLSCSLAIGKPL